MRGKRFLATLMAVLVGFGGFNAMAQEAPEGEATEKAEGKRKRGGEMREKMKALHAKHKAAIDAAEGEEAKKAAVAAMKKEMGALFKKHGKGKRGKMGGHFMKDIPGAKEAFEGAEEEGKKLHKEMKAIKTKHAPLIKAAEGEEAKKAAVAAMKVDLKVVVTKMIDHKIAMQEKMLELTKANKEAIIEKMMEGMEKMGKKHRGKRGEGKGHDKDGKGHDKDND